MGCHFNVPFVVKLVPRGRCLDDEEGLYAMVPAVAEDLILKIGVDHTAVRVHRFSVPYCGA